MAERPLILFTLLLQAAAGAAWILAGLAWWLGAQALAGRGWLLTAGLAAAGVLISFGHLGVPANAWRAASNWRTSYCYHRGDVINSHSIISPLLAGSSPEVSSGVRQQALPRERPR